MNDFFAVIYEELIIKAPTGQYPLIYRELYDFAYTYMGLMFILIPIILLFVFYKFYKNPYANIIHYLILFALIFIITSIPTYSLLSNVIFNSSNPELIEALNNVDSGYYEHAESILLPYALYNAALSIVWGFIISLGMKNISKVQKHLPF